MEVSTSTLDNDSRYGSIRSSSKTSGSDDDDGSSQYSSDEDNDEDIKKLQKQRLREQGRWNYFKEFLIFVPYIWPSKDRGMQFWLLAMLFSLVVERFLNVLIPRQLGIITNALTGAAGTRHFPWNELLIWATFHLLSVVVGNDLLKTAANTRISAFCHKQLTSAAFNHVMGLSMDYHTAKSSGELLKSIEQGTEIGQILEAVFFVAGPVLIDLIVAATYLSSVFDSYMALIIITTSLVYVYAGVRCNNIAASRRREYTDAERKANDVMYDAVSNWQTVSYNNRRKFEQNCYLKAVTRYTSAEVSFWDANNYIDTAQSFIMATGLLIACFLAVYRISQGTAPIGNFVLLITYWNLIESPLCNLAYTYRHTSSILISAERLLQVLQTKPSVQDRDDARVLQVAEGRIDFTDVNFSYDPRKTTLKDLSLTVHPGQTIALVGQTGGGKSTTLKLLYRFYDVTSGSIKIDGQDIRDVTLESLRDAFGVVPQDPSLFNRSIMENLRYSRLSATDEEVHAACKAAAIHDKIVSFPEGYGSKVGERGVRLSGGELQRIAIARVILKDPRIVLLDEATSAVDSSTEAQIQSAFRRLSSGRTTFVIAHRLSTVVNADMILVVDNGEVVERGSHLDLLRKKGRYAQLWSKQIFEAAEVDPGAESH
ncbi:hypothetical protein SLS56_001184 [Neofusicoccum ribis]|uniref:ABC transporter n=1 Tax=Neofusicoccum ribis TaxID=45134 RepID=A0ABR3TBH7_9PEZI